MNFKVGLQLLLSKSDLNWRNVSLVQLPRKQHKSPPPRPTCSFLLTHN